MHVGTVCYCSIIPNLVFTCVLYPFKNAYCLKDYFFEHFTLQLIHLLFRAAVNYVKRYTTAAAVATAATTTITTTTTTTTTGLFI